MRAMRDLTAKALAGLRRIPSCIPLVMAVAFIPAWFAWAAYDRATSVWVASEGRYERWGPYYGYLQREVGFVERVAFLTHDPAARFEGTGPSEAHDWRLVSGDRVLLTGRTRVSETLPRQHVYTPQWYEPGGTRDVMYASYNTYRANSGIVISSTDVPCRKIIQWLSPYAVSRMRSAWIPVDMVSSQVFDGSWGAPGQARKVCEDGMRAGRDVNRDPFLMLFEMPGPGAAAATEPRG